LKFSTTTSHLAAKLRMIFAAERSEWVGGRSAVSAGRRYLLAFRAGDVACDRALAAVGRQEVGRLVGVVAIFVLPHHTERLRGARQSESESAYLEEGRAPTAGVIALPRPFYFDHISAKIGQRLRGPRSWEGQHQRSWERAERAVPARTRERSSTRMWEMAPCALCSGLTS